MPARKIQVGQVWKKDDTAESYLITKVYNEALTTYVVLRRTGAESERPVKVKVITADRFKRCPDIATRSSPTIFNLESIPSLVFWLAGARALR
jgi:hypothetical protein